MGSAWVMTFLDLDTSRFQCGIDNWSSSSQSEAVVILTVLLTVPENSTVIIFTDSQIYVDNYTRAKTEILYTINCHWMKFKNFILWETIIHIIHTGTITLSLNKIKAHSENDFNDITNKLAKETRCFHLIQLN